VLYTRRRFEERFGGGPVKTHHHLLGALQKDFQLLLVFGATKIRSVLGCKGSAKMGSRVARQTIIYERKIAHTNYNNITAKSKEKLVQLQHWRATE